MIILLLLASATTLSHTQESTLGDPAQFTSVTAKGFIGDNTYGPVDMVEFEASGGTRAAHAIVNAFNESKKIGIPKPPNDRHRFSSTVIHIVLTLAKEEITITIHSHQLATVVHGDRRQQYWFEEPFSAEGFVPRFAKFLFADPEKIGLKVRELKRDINDIGPRLKKRQK